MNNRFKFRAWDKEDQRMIIDEQDFIPLFVTNKGVFRLNAHHEGNLYNLLPIKDRFILMQCSSLHDMDGNLTYEDDLVRLTCKEDKNFSKIGKIVFVDGCFGIEFMGRDDIVFYEGLKFRHSGIDMKVVGNIHENPKLLESKDSG